MVRTTRIAAIQKALCFGAFVLELGKIDSNPIRLTESIRIDSVRRIELVFFDSVQFDYTIHISGITMFVNWQPIS